MKILLINNVASFHSTLATSLNKIDGIEARYLITSRHKYIMNNEFEVFVPLSVSKKNPFRFIKHKLNYKRKIKQLISWADAVYYLWDSILDEEDLQFAQAMNKPIFIEWVGSDIRDPEKLSLINPFFNTALDNGYEYRDGEMSNFKREVQIKFSKYNAKVFATPEMKLYIDSQLFPTIYDIFQRINLQDFSPNYPNKLKKRPRIIHSPSAPNAKGTPIILQVIEQLQKEYDFDFVLLHNMTRSDVLKEMQSADIFVDQIICGGHGMAACEAMAFGKPVLCYLMPVLYDLGLPKDCPIVNTNPDNLKEQLIKLILDAELRYELGVKGREYVEKYHDSEIIAAKVLEIIKA